MRYLLGTLMLLVVVSGFAQKYEKITGVVVDQESKQPIFNSYVVLIQEGDTLDIAVTNFTGAYVFDGISPGAYSLRFQSIEYLPKEISRVEVFAGKETVIDVELELSLTVIEGATIEASRPGEAINEMAIISAREFSIEETERYAGSRGDPARMASNFAGVQGADDSRNDIVIRGNSPAGVLWRVEGIDIPNPNHFSIPGTAGGPVSILNNKILRNSDFYTGAFPAEFGNSIAGVFDLKLRNGNPRTHEFSGQFGFLGTEILAEGPLSKKSGSSYLVSYRYSTIALFSAMGIDIGTSAAPKYQDAAFKISLPGKEKGVFSVWGVAGGSSVDILISDQEQPERNIFGENDRDQYFRSKMGVVGATYSRTLNESTYSKSSLAYSREIQDSYHELVYRHLNNDDYYVVDSLVPLMRYNFDQQKIALNQSFNKRLNRNHSLRFGLLAEFLIWNLEDSVRIIDPGSFDHYDWNTRWNNTDNAFLVQPFAQWKWRPSPVITVTAGLHAQHFSLNNSAAWIEPRAGIRYQLAQNQSLSFAYGLHHQTQPYYLYFYSDSTNLSGEPVLYNRDMGFTESHHFVLGHDLIIGNGMRLHSEMYYQHLLNIPVTVHPSSLSMINTGAGFTRFFPGPLENSGLGRNYGVELTLEKAFNRGYFFMFTGSLFDSKYRGSDGVWRNTDFNGKYAINLLGSKEFRINDRKLLVLGGKLTMAGGRWYGPPDVEASNEQKEIVYIDEERNTLQFDDYFRADIKITYTINRDKVSHQIGLDLVNIFNTENVLKLTYAPDESNDPNNSIRVEYQLGFLPVFYYRLNF